MENDGSVNLRYKDLPRRLDFIQKWSTFSNYNCFIEKVNIIPFKCPLERKYDTHLSQFDFFHFEDLYEYSVSVNKPITDIIDLTFTNKYYNPKKEDFAFCRVSHHKFMIPGKNIPDPPILEEILDRIERILQNDGIVGVHCTHGINRTGFIICCYLVMRLGWKPEEALKAFEKSRGYPLEHQDYIEAVLALKIADKRNHNSFDTKKKSKRYY